jgi:predicted permease
VFQFSLAVVLLAAAGLLTRSFLVAQTMNPFMPHDAILTARVQLPAERYSDVEAQHRFIETALDRLAGLTGAKAAAVVSSVPGAGSEFRRIELQGAPIANPGDRPSVAVVSTSPGYFDTFNLRIVDGRGFDASDGAPGREVAIVSRLFARTQWPGQRAIGRQFRFNAEDDPGPWLTVVGVSDDLAQAGRTPANDQVAFVPHRQRDARSLQFAVRAAGDASMLAPGLRQAIQAIDLDLPLERVETMRALVGRQRWAYRVFGTVFGLFAVTALLMAAVGLYAIVSQATARRTREIGIRVALGATPARILRTVMRGGVWQLGVGVVAGSALAWFTTGLMRPLLFGVAPTDPVVFGGSVALLLAVGVVACAIPAWRATRMPPTQALGHDDRTS